MHNHILATIEPHTGQVYLTSVRQGDLRSYLPVGDTFCCNCTGLENPTRFAEPPWQDSSFFLSYYPSPLWTRGNASRG